MRALVEDTGRLERRGRTQGAALEQHRWDGNGLQRGRDRGGPDSGWRGTWTVSSSGFAWLYEPASGTVTS